MPSASQRVEDLGLGFSQRAHGRSDRFGKVSQDRCVQSVGLGQRPRGPGEVSNLAGLTTTTTGSAAAASAATSGNSSPPVASSNTRAGPKSTI